MKGVESMKWGQLFCEKRLSEDNIGEAKEWEGYLNAFEKDYKKIISNAAFRRLQDKTQVFPLDKSDFVRTRLTHSIEVSTIAKQLGVMVAKELENRKKEKKEVIHANEISDILMCAGLLHDLGNPPFGHFGEEVIGGWFRDNLSSTLIDVEIKNKKIALSPQMILDLQQFEGNAQAFRLLSKAKHICGGSNVNITYAVMSSLVKYPCISTQVKGKSASDVRFHKFGCFLSEKKLLNEISKEVGTYCKGDDIIRNPLAFLVEAADDIAYATSDLEDAFKKEKFTLEDFAEYFNDQISKLENAKNCEAKKDYELIKDLKDYLKLEKNRTRESDLNFFNEWVNYTKNWLMYVAAVIFVGNYESILNGKFKVELLEHERSFHRLSIIALKNTMAKYAYDTEDIVRLELSAHTILTFLLDRLIPAVIHYDDNDKQSQMNKKYISLISENYKEDYKASKCKDDESYNLYLRLLMVTDYISGMTDSYAKRIYQELNGRN